MTEPVAGTTALHDRVVDRVTASDLREDLLDAGYTVDVVEALLGPVAASALHREQPVPARRLLDHLADERDASPHVALVRLFLLAMPVSRGEVDAALPRCRTEGLERLGLATAGGSRRSDVVLPLRDLRPYGTCEHDWWVVSDLGEVATGEPVEEDHVLGVGGASTTLAGATLRRRVGRAFDLGTGSGVQALHLATHADQVVASDLCGRALDAAALTLALSGVDPARVDLREGDLLEAVAGERFDLVVSNPPFVITPRRDDVPTMTYRDGGRSGDDLVRHVVTHVADHLAPGGVAQLLGNWEVRRGERWDDVVGAWLEAASERAGERLDAWVVQRDVLDPAQYAETWIRDGGVASGPRYEAMYRAWLDDLEGRGVDHVGFGLLTLRRPGPGTRPLHRLEHVATGDPSNLGAHLDACLAAHDALPDDLLDLRLQVAPDVTEVRHHRPGSADPEVVELRQGGGLARTVRVGSAVAAVVGACDGELAVGPLTAAVAALTDRTAAALRAEVLPVLRALVVDGLLAPAAAAPAAPV